MKSMKQLGLITAVGSLALFGFGLANAQSSADLVAASLNHGDRPSEDAGDDARRMPIEVLSFAGIDAGMDVYEMEAGGGWYTEIIARTVGANGSVTMQNPPSFESFTGDADDNRAASLSNATLDTTNFDDLGAGNSSMDLVTWILGPHELWFAPGGESLGDPDDTFAEIVRILKPGGRLLAIDHDALDGAGPEVGGTLHRIEGSLIQEYAEAAGLTLIRSSNMHRNPEDPMTAGVFDPSIQGRTNKFVMLFEK